MFEVGSTSAVPVGLHFGLGNKAALIGRKQNTMGNITTHISGFTFRADA
jgi:hypothetical protein